MSKVPPHEKVIWTKYQLDLIKIVDFLLITNFLASLVFYASVSILQPKPGHKLGPKYGKILGLNPGTKLELG